MKNKKLEITDPNSYLKAIWDPTQAVYQILDTEGKLVDTATTAQEAAIKITCPPDTEQDWYQELLMEYE